MRKEIIKIGAEISKKESRPATEKINKIKSCCLKNINKLRTLARLGKKKGGKTQMTNIKNEKGDINADSTDMKKEILWTTLYIFENLNGKSPPKTQLTQTYMKEN